MGSPIQQIHGNRGLRQGDPLSPFIFTVVGESLNKLVEKVREMEVVKGFKLTPDGPPVTHLQFADDTLFFCEPDRQELLGYKAILRCFELASGLRINLGKSTIIGTDLDEYFIKDLADGMGCGIDKLPFIYLGLQVGGKSFWSPVIERVERRLVGGASIFHWGVELPLLNLS